MKILARKRARHSALHRWTRVQRYLAREQLTRELLVELQRLRTEVRALRLVLERRRAA